MKDIISESEYSKLLSLQEKINAELRTLFEKNKQKGREHLATILVSEIQHIVDSLNAQGHTFGPCDYSGDVDYENSEQVFSSGKQMGQGIILNFHGFSVQVSWVGNDKYSSVQ